MSQWAVPSACHTPVKFGLPSGIRGTCGVWVCPVARLNANSTAGTKATDIPALKLRDCLRILDLPDTQFQCSDPELDCGFGSVALDRLANATWRECVKFCETSWVCFDCLSICVASALKGRSAVTAGSAGSLLPIPVSRRLVPPGTARLKALPASGP